MSAALPLQDAARDTQVDALTGATALSSRSWAIYAITEHGSGREYVGVTALPLARRFAGHRATALRRKRARAGSLGAAILVSLAARRRYGEAFAIRWLASAGDPDEARALEAHWIAVLGTATPHGFNQMPGGSSLGGELNAQPVTVQHPTEGPVTYPSLSQAIRVTNRQRGSEDRVDPGTVYARLELGWPVEEALGLVAHVDGRGERQPFTWDGQQYRTLRHVSARSGLSISTLRSRLHRLDGARSRSQCDLAQDRRRKGVGRKWQVDSMCLPSPDGDGTTVTAAEFATRTGVAKASVLHRYHQLVRAGRDVASMPLSELHAALTTRADRRIVVALEVAPGVVWRGGVRELIRRLEADRLVECHRPERIQASAIRARLRKAAGWPDRMTTHDIRRAFGFERD